MAYFNELRNERATVVNLKTQFAGKFAYSGWQFCKSSFTLRPLKTKDAIERWLTLAIQQVKPGTKVFYKDIAFQVSSRWPV